jgi:hypothetical protein
MSTSNVNAHLAAHLAILDLLNRYTDAVNQRDWQRLQNVFAANGVWDMGGPAVGPMAMRFEGAKAITEGIAASIATTELCVQTNHAPVIEVDGRHATARSTINELVRPRSGAGMTIVGTYYDDIVLGDDGEWRFKERRFRITYVDTTTLVPGQILASFPRVEP